MRGGALLRVEHRLADVRDHPHERVGIGPGRTRIERDLLRHAAADDALLHRPAAEVEDDGLAVEDAERGGGEDRRHAGGALRVDVVVGELRLAHRHERRRRLRQLLRGRALRTWSGAAAAARRSPRRKSERRLRVDEAGIDVLPLRIDDRGVGRNGHGVADRLDQAVADDDRAVGEFRSADGMHGAADDRVDAGGVGEERRGDREQGEAGEEGSRRNVQKTMIVRRPLAMHAAGRAGPP